MFPVLIVSNKAIPTISLFEALGLGLEVKHDPYIAYD
jgi:hypothetical protein